ncbi:hypothetical protein A9J41_14865 [Laribacter hongkongensis]|nr:hypothetical protein [Laribacter hongkongensis]
MFGFFRQIFGCVCTYVDFYNVCILDQCFVVFVFYEIIKSNLVAFVLQLFDAAYDLLVNNDIFQYLQYYIFFWKQKNKIAKQKVTINIDVETIVLDFFYNTRLTQGIDDDLS